MNTNLDNITDPSDWLNTPLSSLATLETALRCQVCKEFFDTPMITNCSHTFCSLCIRRCLSSDGKCPTCRSEEQSSKLRRNWAIQECVDAFVQSRKSALDLAKGSREIEAPKRKRRKLNSGSQNDQGHADALPRRQTRSSARGGAPATSQEVVVVDSEDDAESDYQPEKLRETVALDDGLVPCPICALRMKEDAVFSHLDHCEGPLSSRKKVKTPPPHQPSRRARFDNKLLPSPAKHLPHLNYSLLRDTALKKKLQESGIPTWGTRQLMIRRHTQWIDISNANSDSPDPKTNRELLRELDVWERTQGGHAHGQGQSGLTGVMRKDFNGSEWAGQNKTQFDDLIAKARAKRVTPKPGSAKSEVDESKVGEQHAETSDQRNSDPMDGITHTARKEAPVRDFLEPDLTATVDSSPKIDTAHSTTQQGPSAADASVSPSPMNSTIPVMNGGLTDAQLPLSTSPVGAARIQSSISTSGVPGGPPVEETSNTPLVTTEEKSRSAIFDTEGSVFTGAKKVPMFRMPEDPIVDAEGVGATVGHG